MTASTADLPAATKLAVDRTRLAYERTLIAWTRTATSLISFGFTIYKFFQYLHEGRPVPDSGMLGPRGFALLMIVIGLTALALAAVEHQFARELELNAMRLLNRYALVCCAALGMVGAGAHAQTPSHPAASFVSTRAVRSDQPPARLAV